MWMILFFMAWAQAAPQAPVAASSALDFDTYKTKVEPMFLEKRPGHARCVVCHSTGTAFRLQQLGAKILVGLDHLAGRRALADRLGA